MNRSASNPGRTDGLAWAIWVVGLCSLVLAVGWQLGSVSSVDGRSALIAQFLGLMAIGGVGLLLATRRRTNAIGWIFLGVWLYTGIFQLVTAYAQRATLVSETEAAASPATWLVNWAWVPIIGVVAFYPLLLFPTGRVLGDRWRPLVPIGAAVMVLWSVGFAFASGQYTDANGNLIGTNPYAPSWASPVLDALPGVGAVLFILLVLAALVSLVLRFRRGDAMVRAQLKWFLIGALCWLPVLLYPGDHGSGGPIDILFGVALAGVPMAMAIAILRYRLYDIDRIISRTATYTLVTAMLVATYAAIVTATTALLPESNALAVAAATLTAAALARPLLRHVQRVVDRRFNRSRYDAQNTVDTFASSMSTQVADTVVLKDLERVVATTLEPAVVGVWLRDSR